MIVNLFFVFLLLSSSDCSCVEANGTLCNAPHGECVEDSCVCDASWHGVDCATQTETVDLNCPIGGVDNKICSGHGSCNNGTGVCTCADLWMEPNCAFRKSHCPCNDHHAECVDNACVCDSTHGGPQCRCKKENGLLEDGCVPFDIRDTCWRVNRDGIREGFDIHIDGNKTHLILLSGGSSTTYPVLGSANDSLFARIVLGAVRFITTEYRLSWPSPPYELTAVFGHSPPSLNVTRELSADGMTSATVHEAQRVSCNGDKATTSLDSKTTLATTTSELAATTKSHEETTIASSTSTGSPSSAHASIAHDKGSADRLTVSSIIACICVALSVLNESHQ